jgi:hypothetical protein
VSDNLEVGSREFNLYKEKYKEHNKLETDDDVIRDYQAKSSKNPLWGRIYGISIGFVDEATNIARIKVLRGDEKDIIQDFLNTCSGHFEKSKMTGFNFSFLLPFLRSRMLHNGMKLHGLHDGMIDIGRKPWTITGLDVQDHFKGLGWYSNSLEETAYLLNLETNFIDGKDIYTYFLAGKEKELNESLVDETFTLINVHRIIVGEEPCKELNSTVVSLGEVKTEELPILEKLFRTEQFNDEVKNYLSTLKIAKKDKPTVEKLVLAHYLKIIDVMAQNKKELKEINTQRTEEVKSFFKTLK